MLAMFFLSSGLFLGWSLGANDAANIFGTAVGSRMLKFRKAAIIASIFVILGAVIQGAGASDTLGKLGAVSTLAAGFTVALCAAFTVYAMTRMKLPVSTSQAVVGAIIGWNFYTNNPTDLKILGKIVTTWISGPILGGIFAALLFLLLGSFARKTRLHLFLRDSLLRFGLIIVGAFGAYSLGANNIANVMGVFVDAVHFPDIDLGFVVINSTEQLFFIGGLAIAFGIITYSRHVMETVGNTLMPLSPGAALVVVLSQSLVLFIFSSTTLSDFVQSIGLPAIPLVPVSSSQVVIGAIIGIGLLKGGREIKFNILGSISLGWVATPLAAAVLSFFMLFFVNNVFKQDVGLAPADVSLAENYTADEAITKLDRTFAAKEITSLQEAGMAGREGPERSYALALIIIAAVVVLSLFISLMLYYARKKKSWEAKLEEAEQNATEECSRLRASLSKQHDAQLESEKELNFRQKEMTNMAMNIIRNNEFLNELKKEISKSKAEIKDPDARESMNRLALMIAQNLNIDRDREKFRMFLNEQNSKFIQQLEEMFPAMTDNEKRLAVMLRMNLSTKEIASILNISPKSVEMNRYRLRKKLKVSSGASLTDFIQNI